MNLKKLLPKKKPRNTKKLLSDAVNKNTKIKMEK